MNRKAAKVRSRAKARRAAVAVAVVTSGACGSSPAAKPPAVVTLPGKICDPRAPVEHHAVPEVGTKERFASKAVDAQFKQAIRTASPVDSLREWRWRVSRQDPEEVMCTFSHLRLRPGYALRAYVHEGLEGSIGMVVALRVGTKLRPPHPVEGPRSLPEAPADVMFAIDGDRSLRSYLEASLLRRALEEFGASWHGIQWAAVDIVDRNPFARDCEWTQPEPADYAVRIERQADRVVVSFITATERVQRRLERIVDEYSPHSYVAKTRSEAIAKCGGGWIP